MRPMPLLPPWRTSRASRMRPRSRLRRGLEQAAHLRQLGEIEPLHGDLRLELAARRIAPGLRIARVAGQARLADLDANVAERGHGRGVDHVGGGFERAGRRGRQERSSRRRACRDSARNGRRPRPQRRCGRCRRRPWSGRSRPPPRCAPGRAPRPRCARSATRPRPSVPRATKFVSSSWPKPMLFSDRSRSTGMTIGGMLQVPARAASSRPLGDRMKLSMSSRRPSSFRDTRGSSSRTEPAPVMRRLAPPSPASIETGSSSTAPPAVLKAGLHGDRDRKPGGRDLRRRAEEHLRRPGHARLPGVGLVLEGELGVDIEARMDVAAARAA